MIKILSCNETPNKTSSENTYRISHIHAILGNEDENNEKYEWLTTAFAFEISGQNPHLLVISSWNDKE